MQVVNDQFMTSTITIITVVITAASYWWYAIRNPASPAVRGHYQTRDRYFSGLHQNRTNSSVLELLDSKTLLLRPMPGLGYVMHNLNDQPEILPQA